MRRVILESPHKGNLIQRFLNRRYARACLKDSLRRGEAPLASHLLYTQVLDDGSSFDRSLGINAGLIWGDLAEYAVIYIDRGVTPGMGMGINRHLQNGLAIEYRSLKNPKGDYRYAKDQKNQKASSACR